MSDDGLIARIYRAAAGLDAWPTVLEEIAQAFRGAGAHIIGIERPAGHITLSLHSSKALAGGVDDQVRDAHANAPQGVRGAELPVGRVVNIRANGSYGHAEATLFKDCLDACEYSHIIGGKVCDDGEFIALSGVCRTSRQGPFSGDDEHRFERLLGHLASAMDVARGTREWRVRSDVGEALLGRSQRPSFMIGPDGKLLFANGAGQDALIEASILVNRGGFIAARDAETDKRLTCALCALGVFGLEGVDRCPDRIPMRLDDVRRGVRVPACLWAIRAHADPGALGANNVGMLILATRAPLKRAIPNPKVLTSMFGFTPAEARVAAHLVAGASPKQITAALELAMPTVRHHIRWLLTKCRCHDQRQLVGRLSEALEVNGL
jgi:DNA-binding CsgD family transcriptional regulator